MNAEGELWKTPQISFYAMSPIHAYLISRHLSQLMNEKKLAYTWQIVLSDYGQTCNITYTLEPKLDNKSELRLGLLQQDLQIIGDRLAESIKYQARYMLTSEAFT